MVVMHAASAVAMTVEILFVVLSVGLTVLIVGIPTDPGAGGELQPALLAFGCRSISAACPSGLGTDLAFICLWIGAGPPGNPVGSIVVARRGLARPQWPSCSSESWNSSG